MSLSQRPQSGKIDSAAIDWAALVPTTITRIANQLARDASHRYLKRFGVGVETWRCLAMLAAVERSVSAQQVSRTIGMDKGSTSRCLGSMRERGLISISVDEYDGRLRRCVLTAKGRALHDDMAGAALERDRAFVSVLTDHELEQLLSMLQRLHDGLAASQKHEDKHRESDRSGPSDPNHSAQIGAIARHADHDAGSTRDS